MTTRKGSGTRRQERIQREQHRPEQNDVDERETQRAIADVRRQDHSADQLPAGAAAG